MQPVCRLRHCLPCVALLAALGHWHVQAADYEAMQVPLLREYPAPYRPPAHNRLVFKSPPSQLYEAWRCARPVISWADVSCSPYERPDINAYTRYPADFLQDPFAPLRFMSQPYPLRPPQPRTGSVPGAPPSQLPYMRTFPSGADFLSPQPLR